MKNHTTSRQTCILPDDGLTEAAPHRELLKEAVHQHRLLSKEGLWERLFTIWFDGWVYNQIWEDPEVDMSALELDANSRIMSIASGGCNALSYLTRDPEVTFAVDLNPCHIYLTRLKVAAFKGLADHESLFRFFGHGEGKENVANYHRHIRPYLDADTRAFWEGGAWVKRKVRGPRIEYFARNLYDHARLGKFLRCLHKAARWMGKDPRQLLRARTMEEREEAFEEHIAPFFNNRLVRRIGRWPFLVYSLGIPPQQYAALRRECDDVVTLYRDRVRRLTCGFPLEDNYFAWQALDRRYDTVHRQAIPTYLRAEHFQTLRERADRVVTVISSVTRFLKSCSPGMVNRFVLLDAQDWMRANELEELWREIVRVGPSGSRVIFRTAAAESPLEAELPADLRRQFHYDAKRSRELHERDRSAIYGGFHVYVRR
jgi:S-adenosylmethionine-diacylglycerol 3-amino-3-carboxypropyl transferase